MPNSGQQVMTVLGPIPVGELGVTLMHEHPSAGFQGWSADLSIVPYDPKLVETRWTKILNELKELGIKTVVCPVMAAQGRRDPVVMRNASIATGIHTVMGTGLFWEGQGASRYYNFLKEQGHDIEQDIYELFKKEITEGVEGTGIKAGIIKVASSDPHITEYERTVFRAGVRASKDTGLPITTHCEGSSVGPEQMDYFLSLGTNPKKIVIGHQNNSTNLNYFLDQLERHDFYLGFDRTGFGDPKGEECIIELIKRGYADRIMLSHDYVATWLGRPFKWKNERLEKDYYPTYIHKKFIPKMKAAGITDSQIHTILVDNPRRLFAER